MLLEPRAERRAVSQPVLQLVPLEVPRVERLLALLLALLRVSLGQLLNYYLLCIKIKTFRW